MKKPTLIILVLSLFLCCGRGPEQVRKIVTDGVDTVLNGIDPYVLKGEPGRLRLEKMFSIDTEYENQLQAEAAGPRRFDSTGIICLYQWTDQGKLYLQVRQATESCLPRSAGMVKAPERSSTAGPSWQALPGN